MGPKVDAARSPDWRQWHPCARCESPTSAGALATLDDRLDRGAINPVRKCCRDIELECKTAAMCAPRSMDAVLATAAARRRPDAAMRRESFSVAEAPEWTNKALVLRLSRSA